MRNVWRQLGLGLMIGAVLLAAAPAGAMQILGTGAGALIGGDLTDPENDGAADADINYNATFTASEEPNFGGGEGAFNVFDNRVGGGNDKWCCGDQNSFPLNPIWVDAELDRGPVWLTHFTLTSGNDTAARDPRVWELQGSNDGVNYVTLMSVNNPNAGLWTARNQVLRFDAGVDFPEPTDQYSHFRLYVTATGLTGGARFQLNEIEYFTPEPSTLALAAAGLVGLIRRRRRA